MTTLCVQQPYLKSNVYLADWSESWADKFQQESEAFRYLLGGNCLAIHHIGSTSIPRLKAKPIIDMLVVVKSFNALENIDFSAYEVKGENGLAGRRYFQKNENGVRITHIHMYEYGHANISTHLRFRDALRANSELAQEYEQLKTKLAQKYHDNKPAYTQAKAGFIQKVLATS